jgi:hypothetical protein
MRLKWEIEVVTVVVRAQESSLRTTQWNFTDSIAQQTFSETLVRSSISYIDVSKINYLGARKKFSIQSLPHAREL